MLGGCRPPRPLRALLLALVALAAATALVACGSEDEDAGPDAENVAADESAGTTETTAEPPPETAPGDASAEAGSRTSTRDGEGGIVEETATGPQSCQDVVITPDSGNGLFGIEAEGITCEDAAAALEAWGSSGYPGAGPPGFSCEEVSQSESGSARLSCEQDASGAVVEFDTGV